MAARLPAPTSVEMSYQEPGDEPTAPEDCCPDCGEEQAVVPDDTAPPDSPDEAWAMPHCSGTADILVWRWCRHLGRLRKPSKGQSIYFDRTELACR